MFDVKGIITMSTADDPMAVMAALGNDENGAGFCATYAGAGEPGQITSLPAEGEPGDWQSYWRFIPGEHYTLAQPISTEDLDRDALAHAFTQQLREHYV